MSSAGGSILLSGALVKRGRFVKNWNLRYFELFESELFYYQHEGGKLKGRFEISESTVFEDASLKVFCFSLTNPVTGDALFMAADDAAGKDLWTESLLNAISICRQKGKKSAVSNRLVDMPEELLYSSKSNLTVKVIQCLNLLDKGTGGTSNPYALVTLGYSNVHTTTRGFCLDPQWGMVFNMEFDRTARYLKIDVFHNSGYKTEQSRKDDFLGCVQLPTLAFNAGYRHKGWHQLRKRSSRSHVRGSIELEISCDVSPRVSYEPYKMYHTIRLLPELRLTVPKPGKDGTRFESKLCNEAIREYVSQIKHGESFPFQYPPVESELFEDFAVKVSLLSTSSVCLPEATVSDNRLILIDGIVILTNYRLIFVSLTRLSSTIDVDNENGMVSCDSTSEAESMNFATHVFLSNIMEVVNSSGTDLGIAGVSGLSDVLRIKVADGRKLSLVFHDSGSSVFTTASATRKQSYVADAEDAARYETKAVPIPSPAASTESSNTTAGLSSSFKKISQLVSTGTTATTTVAAGTPVSGPHSPQPGAGTQAPSSSAAIRNCDFLSTMNYILASLSKNEFSSEDATKNLDESDFLSLQRLLVVCTKLDADDTEEGPPCSRMHHRLCYRVCYQYP